MVLATYLVGLICLYTRENINIKYTKALRIVLVIHGST